MDEDTGVQLLQGDARTVVGTLEAESVHPGLGLGGARMNHKNFEAWKDKPEGVRAPALKGERQYNPNGRNLRNSDFYFDSLDLAIEATRAELAHLTHLRERGGLLLSGDEPLALDVNPQALADAHFASFPEKLVAPLIQAGTSEWGCCAECGAPWVRVVEKGEFTRTGGSYKVTKGSDPMSKSTTFGTPDMPSGRYATRTTGWQASCKCGTTAGQPCTVLDPFAGSGTVMRVATKLGRKSIGIELSEEYLRICRRRNSQLGLLL